MRRNLVVASAIVIVLLLAGAIYIEGPSLVKSSSSNGPTASVSVSAGLSTSAETAASSSGAAGAGDWTTYHANNDRTGYMPVSNFTSVANGWTSPTLDGWVFAEPLVYGGDVFVATENNSVYALSAQDGSVVWRQNLGPPVLGSLLPCGNIEPVTGITGTPVIDPSTGMLYVVAFSDMHHIMYALDVASGAVVFHESASPPGLNDTTQQQRTALTLANSMVYFGYGGLAGDCGLYRGWVVGLPANGTGNMAYYRLPSLNGGGIWAPSGFAVDQAGNLYVATGNSASTTNYDFGEAVIKLSPTLTLEQYFAPADWAILNQDDTDIDSLGSAIIGPNLIFQIGKAGVGFLLNTTQLGGIGGQSFEADVCDEAFGGTAFANSTVFVPCINGLFELKVANASFFSTALVVGGFNAGPPIVTGGVVWSVDDNSAILYGISATTGHQDYSFSLGSVEHFTTPSAGDGQIFVAAANKVMSFVLG